MAALDAGKTVWRDVRRDTQPRIIYALIRHIGAGQHLSIKQYDSAHPSWAPSSGLLYHALDEKWTETVAAALGE